MDIQQLRHFLAVVETGNINRAAVKSHISQSGLSRSLSSLEASVGLPLLTRKPNGVEPTAYGVQLAKHAKVIMKEVKNAIGEMMTLKHGWTGELTIGITPSYSQHTVPDLLAELARVRPELSVIVRTAPAAALRDMALVGEVDIAFGVFSSLEVSDDLETLTLGETQPRVIARAGHPLASASKITARDLSEARWVLMEGQSLQLAFGNYFSNQGAKTPPQALKTNSISVAKRITQITDSLSIVAPDLIPDEISDGRLVVLDCPFPTMATSIGALYRKDALPSPPLELFVDLLKARFADTAPAPRSA